jgi:hypothetical protein
MQSMMERASNEMTGLVGQQNAKMGLKQAK